MSWTIIIAVILAGLFLLVVEFYLIPGTTIVGILGGVVIIAGIYLAFANYGPTAGLITFLVSGVLAIALLVMGYRALTSEKYAVHHAISGKVNVLEQNVVKKGDRGKTFSHLRPNGKAVINGKRLEVWSVGDFIDDEVAVEVTKITGNKIYVKPVPQAESETT